MKDGSYFGKDGRQGRPRKEGTDGKMEGGKGVNTGRQGGRKKK